MFGLDVKYEVVIFSLQLLLFIFMTVNSYFKYKKGNDKRLFTFLGCLLISVGQIGMIISFIIQRSLSFVLVIKIISTAFCAVGALLVVKGGPYRKFLLPKTKN